MWLEILIGLAGIGIWVLALQLIRKWYPVDGWIGKIISIAYLLIYPEIFNLSSASYMICIVILWVGIIINFLNKRRSGLPADDQAS